MSPDKRIMTESKIYRFVDFTIRFILNTWRICGWELKSNESYPPVLFYEHIVKYYTGYCKPFNSKLQQVSRSADEFCPKLCKTGFLGVEWKSNNSADCFMSGIFLRNEMKAVLSTDSSHLKRDRG